MQLELLPILKCLHCGHDGLQQEENSRIVNKETLLDGAGLCPRCRTRYPVKDGIINFLSRRTPNISFGQLPNQFTFTAWGYERLWRKRALSLLGGREWLPEEELATIIEMLNADGFKREGYEVATHNGVAFILDEGSSTGFYARAIACAVRDGKLNMGGAPLQVVAIDNSWQMLQEARKYIEQEGLSDSISLVRADVEDMPFINKAFAGITNGAALNEFKHTEPALSETRRTLDKFGNAVFMVQMKARGKVGRLLDKLITLSSGIKFFDRDQLEQYYDRAGFRLLEQVSSGLVTISRLRKR